MAVYHNGARYVACLNGASFTTLSDHTTHSLVATYAEMKAYIASMDFPVATVSGDDVVVTFTPFAGKYLAYIAQNQDQLPAIKTQVMIQPCRYGPRAVSGGWQHKNSSRRYHHSSRYVCAGNKLGQQGKPFVMHFLTNKNNQTVAQPIVLTAAAASAGTVILTGCAKVVFGTTHCTIDDTAKATMGYAITLNKSGAQSLGACRESNIISIII
jgi:hypothetical protein